MIRVCAVGTSVDEAWIVVEEDGVGSGRVGLSGVALAKLGGGACLSGGDCGMEGCQKKE